MKDRGFVSRAKVEAPKSKREREREKKVLNFFIAPTSIFSSNSSSLWSKHRLFLSLPLSHSLSQFLSLFPSLTHFLTSFPLFPLSLFHPFSLPFFSPLSLANFLSLPLSHLIWLDISSSFGISSSSSPSLIKPDAATCFFTASMIHLQMHSLLPFAIKFALTFQTAVQA